MLRVLIVDDEPWARAELQLLLREQPDVEVVGEADSVTSAEKQLAGLHPDLVFLDIQLRSGSGFALFERTVVQCHVVFVTAFGDHALRAFEVDALDYLVKPVLPEQLDRAVSRARVRIQGSKARNGSADRVYLKDTRGVRACLLTDITHIQAAESFTEVYLVDGSTVLVRQRMHSWEERFPDAFLRIHRSTLVNIAAVERLDLEEGRWIVRLRTVEAPFRVSRRLAQGVKERLETLL